MTTPAKIVANQQNARHSTGPKTRDGKARSAQNAFKHGLTAERNLLPGEDAKAFAALRDECFERLHPDGPIEIGFVTDIVRYRWRLDRGARIESEGLRSVMTLGDYDLSAAVFVTDKHGLITEHLPRYETHLARRLESAIRLLLMLQGRRRRAATRHDWAPAGRRARRSPVELLEVDDQAKMDASEMRRGATTMMEAEPMGSTELPTPNAREAPNEPTGAVSGTGLPASAEVGGTNPSAPIATEGED